jgi:hypothetical protein
MIVGIFEDYKRKLKIRVYKDQKKDNMPKGR